MELARARHEGLDRLVRIKAITTDERVVRAEIEANGPVPGSELLPAEDILVIRRNARKPRKTEVPYEAELLVTAE